jgi:hypothetical protein
MRKESPNGGANRRLAGGKWRVVLTLALGKEVAKEEASAGVTHFIGEGEREREEASLVPPIGVSRLTACRSDRDATRVGRERLPCPCAADGWARDRFQNHSRLVLPTRPHCS